MNKLDPSSVRLAILIFVTIPIVFGWCAAFTVWIITGDIRGLSITTPALLLIATFATGYRITKKAEGDN